MQLEGGGTPTREGQTTLSPEPSRAPPSPVESPEVSLPTVSTTPVQAPALTEQDPSLPRPFVLPLPVGIAIILLGFVWLVWFVRWEERKSH